MVRLLFNANSAFFQLHHSENRLHFDEMMINVRFVLDQQAELDFYCASSLKQQFMVCIIHAAPIGHTILILSQQLGWMSIEQRIKYHKHLLVSKCLKNEVPVYLKNKIQYLSDRNPYSLQNVLSEKLQIPKAKTELFK